MSVQAMAWVLEHSRARGMKRLVLLVIANHADAYGLNAWPSIEKIAAEALCSVTTVKDAVARLTALGEIEVVRCGGKGKFRPTNAYKLTKLQPESDSNSRSGARVTAGTDPEFQPVHGRVSVRRVSKNRPKNRPLTEGDGSREPETKGASRARQIMADLAKKRAMP